MKAHHPNIILHYIPANCTGLFQPCDVGIQHILKHSLKPSYHEDVVDEILGQINKGNAEIKIRKVLGVWQNRTVRWLWNAFVTINKPEVIKR